MYSSNGKPVSRVLIADDDPVIRRWLTSILRSEGYDVVSMSDGRDAYRVLQSDADFKGAVFDLAMPYLDGPDVIRYMRTEKRLMRIPVMLITAEEDIAQVAKGFAAGATVLLPKPFTRQRLQHTLRMMLGHQPEIRTTSLPTVTRTPDPSFSGAQTEVKPFAEQTLIEARSNDLSHPDRPVDLTVLNGLESGDDDRDSSLIAELIDLYRENGTRQLSEIKLASARRNKEAVLRSAHTLKGSSLTMGASLVADVCQKLEAVPEADSDRMAEMVGELEAAFASTAKVFAAERERRLVPAFA